MRLDFYSLERREHGQAVGAHVFYASVRRSQKTIENLFSIESVSDPKDIRNNIDIHCERNPFSITPKFMRISGTPEGLLSHFFYL